ncbi:hypothetical protein HY024_03690 [Candidatus Curtissbacteria bacterium]|nr:hypothetical protein [Candidatus Curtissbacteria bacterium]
MSTTPDRNEGTSTKAERGNIAGRAIRGLGKIVPRRHDSEAESSIYVPGPGRPIRTQLPNEYIIIDGPDKGTFVPRQGQRDLALEDDREEPADWLMRDAAGGRGSFDDSVILPFDEPLSEPAVRRGGFKQQRVVEPPVSQLLAGRDDPEMVPEVTYAHAVAILRDSNAPASDQNVVDLEDFLIDFYGYADENEMYEAVFGGQ